MLQPKTRCDNELYNTMTPLSYLLVPNTYKASKKDSTHETTDMFFFLNLIMAMISFALRFFMMTFFHENYFGESCLDRAIQKRCEVL